MLAADYVVIQLLQHSASPRARSHDLRQSQLTARDISGRYIYIYIYIYVCIYRPDGNVDVEWISGRDALWQEERIGDAGSGAEHQCVAGGGAERAGHLIPKDKKQSESVSASERQDEEQMPRETGTRQGRIPPTGDSHRGEDPAEDPPPEERATQGTHTEHTQTETTC